MLSVTPHSIIIEIVPQQKVERYLLIIVRTRVVRIRPLALFGNPTQLKIVADKVQGSLK